MRRAISLILRSLRSSKRIDSMYNTLAKPIRSNTVFYYRTERNSMSERILTGTPEEAAAQLWAHIEEKQW